MKKIIIISLAALFFGCEEEVQDECLQIQWYFDKDLDGLGRADSSIWQCDQPEGFVNNGFDGDDEPFVAPPSKRLPFTFTPGSQKAFYLKQTEASYGFWFYTPPNYDSLDSKEHPLLIHLHGLGERGNSDKNPGGMNIILWNGAPRLIREDRWDDPHEMIVVAPQAEVVWNADELHEFIEFLVDKLHIDESRIYMTGLSFGANGSFNYVAKKGDDAYVAAIVPIAGWGDSETGSQYQNMPTWAFHGDADDVVLVDGSIAMIDSINVYNPTPTAKLTIYPGVLHDSWARTYDNTGMGDESVDYDPFNESIWDWMMTYQKQ